MKKFSTYFVVLSVLSLIGFSCSRTPTPQPPNPYSTMIVKLAELEAMAETGTTIDDLNRKLIEFRSEQKLHPLTNDFDVVYGRSVEVDCELLSTLVDARHVWIRTRGEDPERVTYGPNADWYESWRFNRTNSLHDLQRSASTLRAHLLTNGLPAQK